MKKGTMMLVKSTLMTRGVATRTIAKKDQVYIKFRSRTTV